jgi:hypothetical protein
MQAWVLDIGSLPVFGITLRSGVACRLRQWEPVPHHLPERCFRDAAPRVGRHDAFHG